MLTKENVAWSLADGECFVSRGSVISQGKELHYTLQTEEFFFLNENGEKEGSTVTYSYFLDCDEAEKRPVMFVYEGGPGASVGDMHISMYGARIYDFCDQKFVKTKAPYPYKDNDDWILDVCDLVLVDPVGTGFGRLLDPKAAGKFFGHEQDNFAQARLIAHWLHKHGRKNSPKFLNGVSYGGHRCCLIPRYLMGGLNVPDSQIHAIGLNGIIMMGDVSLVDTNIDCGEEMPPAGDIPDICFLVAGYAATNWYHRPEGKPDQNTFVDEAHAFAFGDLLTVLEKGADAPEEERKNAAGKLAEYIGIDAETILKVDFKIDMVSFSHMYALADEGKAVGVYDSRYTLPGGAITTPTFDMIADDPAEARTWAATAALVSEIYKKEYGIEFSDGRGYVHENFEAYHMWDWKIQDGTKPVDWQLFNMRHQQDMNLMIVSGLYDLCWNTGYSRYEAECAGFPAERTELRVYPSGHAMYFDDEVRHMMARDFREFIRKSV